MGLYEVVRTGSESPSLGWVAEAKTYTLYERPGPMWYANFVARGRQVRASTGCRDHASAKALVESYRAKSLGPNVHINTKHLYRMIERARYKLRNKGIPMSIGIADMKALVERCGGYCEVSGHPLEDDGPFRPSLDRIVPTLGYVPENVRIVCLVTNTAMLHYGETAFAEIAIAYCRKRGLLT
jgi:hypothetical protein